MHLLWVPMNSSGNYLFKGASETSGLTLSLSSEKGMCCARVIADQFISRSNPEFCACAADPTVFANLRGQAPNLCVAPAPRHPVRNRVQHNVYPVFCRAVSDVQARWLRVINSTDSVFINCFPASVPLCLIASRQNLSKISGSGDQTATSR